MIAKCNIYFGKFNVLYYSMNNNSYAALNTLADVFKVHITEMIFYKTLRHIQLSTILDILLKGRIINDEKREI